MTLVQRKLFDLKAPNKSTGILHGECSGIVNWNDLRYPWVKSKNDTMLNNFWKPDEINMTDDRKQWLQLSKQEQEAIKNIIGLLASLDSIQTTYCGKVKDYVKDASISSTISNIEFQEMIHNLSYSYAFQSLPVPLEESNEIFERWKKDPVLIERNQLVFDVYNDFVNNMNEMTLAKSIIADIVLEGLYFYSGFVFFYNLKRHGKMNGFYQIISYINRDEHIHVGFFVELLKAIISEEKLDKDELELFAHDLFYKASKNEMKWARHAVGEAYQNVTMEEVDGYIMFYANYRLKQMGFSPIFDGVEKNPLKWISQMSSINNGKVDFFEAKSRTYTKVSDVNGFDDL